MFQLDEINYFFTAEQPAIVVILIASVGGKLILTNNKNGKGATAEFLIPIHKESIHDGEQENINT